MAARFPDVLKMTVSSQKPTRTKPHSMFWKRKQTPRHLSVTLKASWLPSNAACLFLFELCRIKVGQAWSFWRVCSWSTWQPWTVGLSWASRCVRCRSSPPNTDRCRSHLCWHTEHGGCNGETQLNIRPCLWRGGDLKIFPHVGYLIASYRSGAAS